VGKAIVRAVLRGRGADVYVPGYTGAINTAMSVMPRSLRDAIHQLMRADTVLTDIDQSARAGYNTRVAAVDKPHAAGLNSTVQPPQSASPSNPGDHHRCRRQVSHLQTRTKLRRPSATTTVVAQGISRRLFAPGGSPPCEIHLRANVLTRHTGLPTTNPTDVYTKLARPTIHPQCAWKERHAEHF
jgi:hypothetical protein